MLYQRIALTILAALLLSGSYAQGLECAFDDSKPDPSIANSSAKNASCGNTFRLHFYLLRDDDGLNGAYNDLLSTGDVSSEDDMVAQILSMLNTGFAFSQYPDKLAEEAHSGNPYIDDIQFVSEGWDYIDDASLWQPSSPDMIDLLDAQSSCTAINIYVGTSSTESQAAFDQLVKRGLRLKLEHILDFGILCHEMGHMFGLLHTYILSGRFNVLGLYHSPYGGAGEVYELTAAFPFGENCATDNDQVCDTYPVVGYPTSDDCIYEPVPQFNNYYIYMPNVIGENIDPNNLEQYDIFPFARVDEFGQPFEFRQYDNFMGPNHNASCTNKFTPGQSQRMGERVQYASSLLASCEPGFNALHSLVMVPPTNCYSNDASISVDVPTSYTVHLTDENGTIVLSATSELVVENLAPAIYYFTVQGALECDTYSFTIEVPIEECPEDLNNDGQVSAMDVTVFLSAYGTECCPADINKDGVIDFEDLQLILAGYGHTCTSCEEDINEDGIVDSDDYQILNALYNTSCDCCPGDFNYDGFVTSADLSQLLGAFGSSCPIPAAKSGGDIGDKEAIGSILSSLSKEQRDLLRSILDAEGLGAETIPTAILASRSSGQVYIKELQNWTGEVQLFGPSGQLIRSTNLNNGLFQLSESFATGLYQLVWNNKGDRNYVGIQIMP